MLTWKGLWEPGQPNNWSSFICLLYLLYFYFLIIKTLIIFLLVIQALVALVNDPEPEHPLRADLAEEYSKDRKKFFKNAEEFTKKFSEKRPPD